MNKTMHTLPDLVDGFDLLPDVKYDFENYRQCEWEVIGPALKEKGYQLLGCWYSPEYDSFGPLSRAVDVMNRNTGKRFTVFYS